MYLLGKNWLKLLTSVLFMRCLFSIPLSIFSKQFFAVALQFEIWFHDRFDLFDLFNLAFLDTALTRSTR